MTHTSTHINFAPKVKRRKVVASHVKYKSFHIFYNEYIPFVQCESMRIPKKTQKDFKKELTFNSTRLLPNMKVLWSSHLSFNEIL